MQALTYFAGWRTCTPQEAGQQVVGQVVGIGAFLALGIGMYYLFRFVGRSRLNTGGKTALYIVLGLLTLPVCIGIPFAIAMLITPWCS